MILENIQKIRNAINSENQSIVLIMDNMKIYNSARDVFIWDDVNCVLNILRLNINPKTQHNKPIIFETFEYCSIMYIRINSTQSNIDDMLELMN